MLKKSTWCQVKRKYQRFLNYISWDYKSFVYTGCVQTSLLLSLFYVRYRSFLLSQHISKSEGISIHIVLIQSDGGYALRMCGLILHRNIWPSAYVIAVACKLASSSAVRWRYANSRKVLKLREKIAFLGRIVWLANHSLASEWPGRAG